MTRKKIQARRQLILEQYAREIMSLAEMQEWLERKGISVTRSTVAKDYRILQLNSGKRAGRPYGKGRTA